ncbi:MAG: zeta toxin family protein [Xanthomonadales bacterium]|nr:zeta toxin family protein [Xanthomonadales bacterium]
MGDTPQIFIIAGPNGAGKTTFAREYLPNEAATPMFVNADLIAAGLSPFDPDVAAIQAGRLMLEQIATHVRKRESFAFETPLSGKGYARQIPGWQANGFQVSLIFLQLPDADAAVARVAQRVREGGHNVPEMVIRRRFAAGIENFRRLYRPLVDHWLLYDNAGQVPVLLEQGDREETP